MVRQLFNLKQCYLIFFVFVLLDLSKKHYKLPLTIQSNNEIKINLACYLYIFINCVLFKTKNKLHTEMFIAKAKGPSIKDVCTNRKKLTPPSLSAKFMH